MVRELHSSTECGAKHDLRSLEDPILRKERADARRILFNHSNESEIFWCGLRLKDGEFSGAI